jgi:hypothetical protein
MTKQEFSRAYRVSRRWVSVGALGLLALWLWVFLAVSLKFKRWFDAHDTVALLWAGFTLVLFVAGVAGIAKFVYKKYGLTCPSCGGWIASQTMMLKTGRCPKCKREMFHDA